MVSAGWIRKLAAYAIVNKPAPHRLGEDPLGHPPRQRLLGLLVRHQLHAEQQAHAVDEADERVAIDEAPAARA